MPSATIDEDRIRTQLIEKLIYCEDVLSRYSVDNFSVAKRRRNSHLKHLGTQYFSCAYTEDLVQYYAHLTGKLEKAGLLKEVQDG